MAARWSSPAAATEGAGVGPGHRRTDRRPFTGHTGYVLAVAAAELDGRPVVISGSGDGTVRVWDLATGAPIGDPFTGHTGWVLAVAAAELDGRPVVISGGDDRTVRVWDLATGAPIGDPFTGHTGSVRAVAAAELDGRPVVISGGDDRTVRVWDLATGAPIGDPFTGHTGWVPAVAAAELDGRPVVISGGDDRTVRVWDLATGAPSAARSPATPARCWRWRPRSWTAARWLSPAAMTGRCGCGTWPPAHRSAPFTGHTDRMRGGGGGAG